MMFVIVGKKSERRILIDHFRFKDSLIPVNHLLKASCAIDDVRELRRFRHVLIPFWLSHERPVLREALTLLKQRRVVIDRKNRGSTSRRALGTPHPFRPHQTS